MTGEMNSSTYHKVKSQAMEYYSNNKIQYKIEDVLNRMFFNQPDDIYGYLANYFEEFSRPSTLSQIEARIVLDAYTHPTLETNIYCTVKNHRKLVVTFISSNYWELHDNSKVEETMAHFEEIKASAHAAVPIINNAISAGVFGTQPGEQRQIDRIIREIMENITPPPEEVVFVEKAVKLPSNDKMDKKSAKKARKTPVIVLPMEPPRVPTTPGVVCLPAVSQAVCVAAAKVKGVELYDHISSLASGAALVDYRLPQPIITLIHAGKVSPGKVKCLKEVSIIPRPDMPMCEVLEHVSDIYHRLYHTLIVKQGFTTMNTSPMGALVSSYDKVEQCLDVVQEAITNQQLTPGVDFKLVINCAAHEILDMEKGKYEIATGLLKSAEELVDYWADLVTRYPAIVGLIDPFRRAEVIQWRELAIKVSDRCFVVGDFAMPFASSLTHDALDACVQTNAAVLRLNRMNTLTDLITCTAILKDNNIEPMISTSHGETTDPFIIDLALGLGIRFIKMGAPNRGENVTKLARLQAVETALRNNDKLAQHGDYVFHQVVPPVIGDEGQPENGDNQ